MQMARLLEPIILSYQRFLLVRLFGKPKMRVSIPGVMGLLQKRSKGDFLGRTIAVERLMTFVASLALYYKTDYRSSNISRLLEIMTGMAFEVSNPLVIEAKDRIDYFNLISDLLLYTITNRTPCKCILVSMARTLSLHI